MESFLLPMLSRKALAAVEQKAEVKSLTVTHDIDESVTQIIGNEFS